MIKSIVRFIDLGEGHDHKALVFGSEKPRKSWRTAMMKPRSSQPLRTAKKLQKKPKARPADKAEKGLLPKTKFDLPKSFDLDRFSPTHLTSLFSVVFGPLPHKPAPGSEIPRGRKLFRIVEDSAHWAKNLRIGEDLAFGEKP